MSSSVQGREAALYAALHRIATEGDALSGQECQEIAAEALGIPVPNPPIIPQVTKGIEPIESTASCGPLFEHGPDLETLLKYGPLGRRE